jgi:hypothetical protein
MVRLGLLACLSVEVAVAVAVAAPVISLLALAQ